MLVLMSEDSKPKEVKQIPSGSFSVNLDIEQLNDLTSGSCIIGSTIPVEDQQSEKVAICKEGRTIKIFKITEEEKK